MPLNLVDLGTAGVPNSGDTIRDGGEKINANFEYLDTRVDSIETNVESSLEDAQAAATASEEAALEAQEAAALANAYQGEWSSATGAATKGSSYEYNGIVWMLLVDVPDITATTPSTSNSDWIVAGGGTAAAYDVTTSTTDTSLGGNGQPRVMRVGDFGVGSVIVSAVTDLDNLTDNGLFQFDNNPSNRPSGISSGTFFECRVSNWTQRTLIIQEITVYGALETHRKYLRRRISGVWSTWQEILHTGNMVGTVSQSGGVPAGSIIERGSNANGEYVKFADGTLICWKSSATLYNIDQGPLGAYYYNNGELFTFPVSFTAAPNLSITSSGSGSYAVLSHYKSSLSSSGVRIGAQDDRSGLGVYPAYVAIGRWY